MILRESESTQLYAGGRGGDVSGHSPGGIIFRNDLSETKRINICGDNVRITGALFNHVATSFQRPLIKGNEQKLSKSNALVFSHSIHSLHEQCIPDIRCSFSSLK